jgi:hypothetical protein
MKLTTDRPFADPEKAARRLMQRALAFAFASQQFRWFFADGVIRLVAHMLIVLRAAVRLPGPCFKKVTPS